MLPGLVVSKALKERAAARLAEVENVDFTKAHPDSDDTESSGGSSDEGEDGKAGAGGGGKPGAAKTAPGSGSKGGAASEPKQPKQRKATLFEETAGGIEEDPEKEVLAFEVLPEQVRACACVCEKGGGAEVCWENLDCPVVMWAACSSCHISFHTPPRAHTSPGGAREAALPAWWPQLPHAGGV